MTEYELTEKFLRSMGYKFQKRGTRNDNLAPILPFIIMDIYYTYWTGGLKPDGFSQRKKLLLRRTSEAYNRLNRRFFSAFSEDEMDAVIELMDQLQTSVNNQVKIAEVSAWNVFKDHPDCDVMVSAFMCNLCAKAAQAVWLVVYKDGRGRSLHNKELDRILFLTKEFAREIGDEEVPENKERYIKNLLAAEDSLGRAIIRWLYSEKEL